MPLGEIIAEVTLFRLPKISREGVTASVRETKEATLRRAVESVEDAVWALEAREHAVIRDLWEHVEDIDEFEEWGFSSPYPRGVVQVRSGYFGRHYRAIVEHIAERDGVDPVAVFFMLGSNRRLVGEKTKVSHWRHLCEYLAEEHGIDTSDWTHGTEP